MLGQERVEFAQGAGQRAERAGGLLHLARRQRPGREPRDDRLDGRQHAGDGALQARRDRGGVRRARCGCGRANDGRVWLC